MGRRTLTGQKGAVLEGGRRQVRMARYGEEDADRSGGRCTLKRAHDRSGGRCVVRRASAGQEGTVW